MLTMFLKKIKLKVIVNSLFPITRWSTSYDVNTGVGDLIAGVAVALTLIPQSIAYASLAGLEPQYGLYASFAGGFVYAVMGTCPQINIGPTALLSLLTFSYTNGTNPDFAVLLCFIGGIFQLLAGILQLGFLVDLVSLPVVSGFTSAAAVTIASSQVKGLLGLSFSSETFVSTWRGIFNHITETRLPDTLLSLACCIALNGMKILKDVKINCKKDKKPEDSSWKIEKALWFAGVGRNVVVVILATVVAYFVHEDKKHPFILTGKITSGLPTPQLPMFTTISGNTTYTTNQMITHLGSGLFVVPLVGIISNVAIVKAFSIGKTLDATQEIVALGVCNIIGAFFRSFPVNGSFTRSAVSDASDVRTPAAGFYTGVIVLLTLVLLTPYFYYIPRATLAAVIVCAVLCMVDLQIIKKLWKINRLDLIPLFGTFVLCLALGIELGLVCGVGIDVLMILYYQARPPLEVKVVNDGVLPAHLAVYLVGRLHFAGAERIRSKLSLIEKPLTNERTDLTRSMPSISQSQDNGFPETVQGLNRTVADSPTDAITRDVAIALPRAPNILVIYCQALYNVDYTTLQSLKSLSNEWRQGLVLWCNTRTSIRSKICAVLSDAIICDDGNLKSIITGISQVDESHITTVDTAL